MTLKTDKYARKPFYVDAVQVTPENMEEVAEWCQGDVSIIKIFSRKDLKKPPKPFIRVRVYRPFNDHQTAKAFVGDWILYSGTGYKVYSEKAFRNSFEMVEPAADSNEPDETLPGEVIDGNG